MICKGQITHNSLTVCTPKLLHVFITFGPPLIKIHIPVKELQFIILIQMKGKISKINIFIDSTYIIIFQKWWKQKLGTKYTGTNKSLTNLTKIMRETYLFNLLLI